MRTEFNLAIIELAESVEFNNKEITLVIGDKTVVYRLQIGPFITLELSIAVNGMMWHHDRIRDDSAKRRELIEFWRAAELRYKLMRNKAHGDKWRGIKEWWCEFSEDGVVA